MTTTQNRLRLWPGVLIVTLAWVVRFGMPVVAPDTLPYAVGGGLLGGVAVLVWWAFFSGAQRVERWGGLGLIVVALVASSKLLHASIAGGMMGLMFWIYSIPVAGLAIVVWAVASRGLSGGIRRATMLMTVLLASGGWTLLRTNGMTGGAVSDFTWRWAPTAEDRMLARTKEPAAVVVEKTAEAPKVVAPVMAKPMVRWAGFRGPNRDSVWRGVRIETDWAKRPPVEIWRQPVGPGWSSFAVEGDRFYTQEQRGAEEVVSCYLVSTGKLVWRHGDAARFWESNAGAGPRATPTLHNGRVYTFGATGILNALDALDGTVKWTRNAGVDGGIKVPGWGFASSPLVVGDLVVIAAEGKLVGYDLATGVPRWFGPEGGSGYSSPHLATIAGVQQIVLLSGPGATSVTVEEGARLWEHALPAGARIAQPGLTAEGDLLLSEGEGRPLHRVVIARGEGGWTTEERWNSNGLKPYFNDFVVHKGHAYGFDGSILACIDLKDGQRKWKGGRYGHGQLILLAEQDLLLVLTEEGELALVLAVADGFTEKGRIHAIEGKTWNHPVLAGDVLLVRNGEEMAAFRLAMPKR